MSLLQYIPIAARVTRSLNEHIKSPLNCKDLLIGCFLFSLSTQPRLLCLTRIEKGELLTPVEISSRDSLFLLLMHRQQRSRFLIHPTQGTNQITICQRSISHHQSARKQRVTRQAKGEPPRNIHTRSFWVLKVRSRKLPLENLFSASLKSLLFDPCLISSN